MTSRNGSVQKIAALIAAIMAKAESTEHSGEAASFMAKAEELMEEYGISILDLETLDDPIGSEFENGPKWSGAWQRDLGSAVAQFFGAQMIAHHMPYRNNGTSTIVGKLSSRIMTVEMFRYLKKEIGRRASSLIQEGDRRSREAIKRSIAVCLIVRIYRIIRDRKTSQTSDGRSLVVVDAVEAVVRDMFPDLSSVRGVEMRATNRDVEAASGISLDAQIRGNGSSSSSSEQRLDMIRGIGYDR